LSRADEDAEMLSVVDSLDEVVGSQRRDEVHQQGLRHRAVHVLVFNSSGELFLQRRGLHKQENPGMWDSSVAGHVDAGESYDRCCVREIEEEIGLSLDEIPEALFKLEASPITGMEFAWVYRLVSDTDLKLNLDEMQGGAWLRQADVNDWVDSGAEQLSDVFQLIWSMFRSSQYVQQD